MTFFRPFQVCATGGATSDTRNTQLAATIAALDVPLKPSEPYTVAAGDGIRDIAVTWHFEPQAPNGLRPGAVICAWNDNDWLAANSKNPVARCRRAFQTYRAMVAQTRGGPPAVAQLNTSEPTHRTEDTRKAACMEALGHPLLGWTKSEQWFRWHFPQAAAADLALYDKPDLHIALPHANISYLRAALSNYVEMLKWVKSAQFIRVQHKQRIAMVGVSAPKHTVDLLEKLLYRK